MCKVTKNFFLFYGNVKEFLRLFPFLTFQMKYPLIQRPRIGCGLIRTDVVIMHSLRFNFAKIKANCASYVHSSPSLVFLCLAFGIWYLVFGI